MLWQLGILYYFRGLKRHKNVSSVQNYKGTQEITASLIKSGLQIDFLEFEKFGTLFYFFFHKTVFVIYLSNFKYVWKMS